MSAIRRMMMRKGDVLPSGYTKLNYIEANSEHTWMDTGVVPKTSPRVVVNAMLKHTDDRDFLGFSSVISDSAFTINPKIASKTIYDKFGSRTTGYTHVQILDATSVFEIDFSANGLKVNGTFYTGNYTNYNFSSNTNTIFIGRGRSSFVSYRIYGAKIYDDDVLLRDFIPCKNNENVCGLYDLTNATFYASQDSSNPFTGG